MNLSDFQTAAERTMTDRDNIGRMQNAALGLCGEAAELAEIVDGVAPIRDEAGDILWYVAQMCKAFDMSIAEIPPVGFVYDEDEAMPILFFYVGKVADTIKKLVYHKKPINPVDLARNLQQIVTAVASLLDTREDTLEDACEYNNAKLLKRFPDGFSHEAANARRDEAIQ